MSELPPNPYNATTDNVATRSTQRTTINAKPISEVTETISGNPATGAHDVERTENRLTTIDGRSATDKSVVCIACNNLVAPDASRPCWRCKRIVCYADVRRVYREGQRVEVCPSCRWKTVFQELRRVP